jgi:hypothetical protein
MQELRPTAAAPSPDAVELHPEAREARGRLARWWPALAG